MPKKNPSFFLSRHYPYYIVAPDYRQTSAGIRATHYLCHVLNEQGYEAYVTAEKTSPFLRTPKLDDTVRDCHRLVGRPGIAVYPEIVSGNPLSQDVVVRWLLNKAGHLGGDEKPAPTDIVFHWDAWVLTPDLVSRRLHLPVIDARIFNSNDVHNQARSGFCYYAHKYLGFGGKVDSWLTRNGVSLCHDIPRPPEEIADILRHSTVLYCYEPSAIALEANACGCPVVYVATPYLEQFEWSAAERAMMTLENRLPDTPAPTHDVTEWYKPWADQQLKETRKELSDFIRITQNAARKTAKRRAFLAEKSAPQASAAEIAHSHNYKRWLSFRRIDDSVCTILAETIASWRNPPEFHLIVRIGEADHAALAETLDSLNYQLYNRWHIDIISDQPCPDGLEALPSVGWQQTERDTAKPTIDFLVASGQRDWIIELPAGAILDPLCLWRIAEHAESSGGEIGAMFTDDDIYDKRGIRNAPRFKPGVNPAHLQSADLAGPLFLRRDFWRTSGGAAQHPQSPWFDQMIRIVATHGWGVLNHIPDVLISYLEHFPSSPENCLQALLAPKSTVTGCEIIPVTEHSWRIRHPLPTIPSATIAIVSRGQLEFLQGCLESLAEHTPWTGLELLLIREQVDDAELESWLTTYRLHDVAPRQVFLRYGASWAEACNAGVVSATHEHVILLQEDTRILDPNWLENLIRTLGEPDVSAVSPRLIRPSTGLIAYAGDVLGLNDENASPYQDETRFSEYGYLDSLQVARDVSLLADGCILLKRSDYIAVEGMEAEHLPDHLAHHDLSLKLLSAGKRLVYQPQSTLVHYGAALRQHSAMQDAQHQEARKAASCNLAQRWLRKGIADPYWNSNLSLAGKQPFPETAYHPAWQYLPANLPRIAARPVTNGQGDFRITSPLLAARQAGLVLDCLWPQSDSREFTAAEIARLGADTLIVQNYLIDSRLTGLAEWRRHGTDTHIVYAIDDLCTEMPEASSLRSNVPANARSRLKFALSQCDRLVVSTDFLAEAYRHFIDDIRVVPNRLEQRIWGSLQSRKQTGKKPRIGWSGGTTHLGDLRLLKEVVAATHDEADWIFFGMCPDEIRPLISEYHGFTQLSDYPAKLASLNLDIAVAPLEMNRFNQAKSNLRLLDYGILGIPVVCTDITPYQSSPAKCVQNTPQAWIEALRERITDPIAAGAEGEALRQWVNRDYILENHHAEWLAAHLP